MVTWRGFIVSHEWSLLQLHLLSSFFLSTDFSCYKAASYFFLFIDWSALEYDARFGHRKIPSKTYWKCGLNDQSDGWAWKILRGKKEISISCHHVVSWVNRGTRGAFNRVEKYFRESDNHKIRFHFIIFFWHKLRLGIDFYQYFSIKFNRNVIFSLVSLDIILGKHKKV